MAQNRIIPAVSASALIWPASTIANPGVEGKTVIFKRKLKGVTIAALGAAGSMIQLYDHVDASDATKLIYQLDGSVAGPSIDLDFPFTQLYAKITTGGTYNIIIN